MKRQPKKLSLNRETLLNLSLVRGGNPPSKVGSDCEACITLVEPVTELDCASGGCATGVYSQCLSHCLYC